MRQPQRWRNLALAVFSASAAALATALLLRDGPESALQTTLRVGGLIAGAWSLVALVTLQVLVAGQARLRRGERVLARWHVDAARCEAFLDRAARQPGPAPDDRMIRRPVPPDGVDVIIGERSVQVGDNFQFTYSELRGVAVAAGPPPWLDFHMAYFRRHGPPLPGILRVPMAEGVEDDAARVLAHHRAALATRGARRSLVQRHPVRVRNIALMVSATCAAAFMVGWLLRHDRALGEPAQLAMVVGLMVGLAALLLGLIAARTASRQ